MKQDLGGAKPTILVPVDLASIANKNVAEDRQAAQHTVPSPPPMRDVCFSTFLPCKLSGIAADWPAVHKWSAAYLRSVVGMCEVNVMRSSSTAFYGDLGRHSPSTATVAEVLDNTPAAAEYMYIAQEPLWHQGSSASVDSCPLAPLLADLPQSPPSFVVRCTYAARALYHASSLTLATQPQDKLVSICLWISARATQSGVHYDPNHNLLCCLHGQKRVRMWPPAQTAEGRPMPVGGESSNHSSAGLSDAPWSSSSYNFLLEPGDAVFIPEGFWHQVDSTPGTIAINYWFQSPLDSVLSQVTKHAPFQMDVYIARRCIDRAVRAKIDELVDSERVRLSAAPVTDSLHAILIKPESQPNELKCRVTGRVASISAQQLRSDVHQLMEEHGDLPLLPRLLLDCLTPIGAELLTRAFEAKCQTTGTPVFAPDFMGKLYGCMPNVALPVFMRSLLALKEQVAARAREHVMDSVFGAKRLREALH